MAARSTFFALALLLSACSPTPPPALPQADVQEFVKAYVGAFNAGDDSKLMGLIQHDAAVSSITSGKLYRGWDAINTSENENINALARVSVSVGAIDVTPLGADTALAVAPMVVTAEGFPADGGPKLTSMDYPGALTMIVKRTPEGLRLIHEHYSVRVQAPAKGA
ncbi:MAG TPA: nuclear transport factor 2 family protein [Burkholderiales bacterium]|jgi:ketosteroid isomerase-like protein